jgi:hypothetical protein
MTTKKHLNDGHCYTVKGKDGKSHDIRVEALESAVGELHACLKVCHRIEISDFEVLRSILMHHFPHEFTDSCRHLDMNQIAGIGRTIASQMHLYFTFKARK